jgi:hypothetical protein
MVNLPWVSVVRLGRVQSRPVDGATLGAALADTAGTSLGAGLGATLAALGGGAEGDGVAALEQPTTKRATPRTATRDTNLTDDPPPKNSESVIGARAFRPGIPKRRLEEGRRRFGRERPPRREEGERPDDRRYAVRGSV